MPPNLPCQQIHEIKAAFDLFDVEGTGKVDAKAIQRCLLSLRLDAKTPALYTLLSELETSAE